MHHTGLYDGLGVGGFDRLRRGNVPCRAVRRVRFCACVHRTPSRLDNAHVGADAQPVVQVRRRPETTVLYQVVREHAETLFAEARRRSESGASYPRYVEEEFRRFSECGILGRGFARIRCEDCGQEELLAFSCKVRSLCPSCVGRRMADTAARLEGARLPDFGYRQWTFSFPYRLRLPLAQDGQLLSRVFRICMQKVFAWQRKRARDLGAVHPRNLGVLFVQRFGSLLQLNIHGHSVLPDGVLVDDGDGGLALFALPPPSTEEVERVTLAIAKAVLKLLPHWEQGEEEDESSVQLLSEAAVAGTGRKGSPSEETPVPPGRRRSNVRTEIGVFSVHADTSASPEDRAALERMLLLRRPARLRAKAPDASALGEALLPPASPLLHRANRSRSRAGRLSSQTRLSDTAAQTKPDPFLRPSGLASPRPT